MPSINLFKAYLDHFAPPRALFRWNNAPSFPLTFFRLLVSLVSRGPVVSRELSDLPICCQLVKFVKLKLESD